MIAAPLLLAALVLGSGGPQDATAFVAPQDSSTSASAAAGAAPRRVTPEQEEQFKQKLEQAKVRHEPERQTAIRINDLAGNIHSEADARKLVDAVAEELTHHRHLLWAAQSIRHRVARAEYEAVSDPSGLIPEQRIVDVWNEYVREIDAPEEALVTVAELHDLRSMDVHFSQHNWELDMTQSIWSAPNVYSLDANGKLAEGCRALEALKIIHNMHDSFYRVRMARSNERMQALGSEMLKQRAQGLMPTPVVSSAELRARSSNPDPIRSAVYRYQQEHGGHAYDQLVRRLFDELLPAE